MKSFKYCLTVLMLCAMACGAMAGLDDVVKTFTLAGSTANTNSYVIHGEIESVRVWLDTAAAGVTGALVVTSSDDVNVATLTTTNAAIAYPRISVTDVEGTTIGDGTNAVTKIPVSGKLTLVTTQTSPTTTNTWKTKIVFKK